MNLYGSYTYTGDLMVDLYSDPPRAPGRQSLLSGCAASGASPGQYHGREGGGRGGGGMSLFAAYLDLIKEEIGYFVLIYCLF